MSFHELLDDMHIDQQYMSASIWINVQKPVDDVAVAVGLTTNTKDEIFPQICVNGNVTVVTPIGTIFDDNAVS